jgi:hypothetical protein
MYCRIPDNNVSMSYTQSQNTYTTDNTTLRIPEGQAMMLCYYIIKAIVVHPTTASTG